jgi:hypothetical protein
MTIKNSENTILDRKRVSHRKSAFGKKKINRDGLTMIGTTSGG